MEITDAAQVAARSAASRWRFNGCWPASWLARRELVFVVAVLLAVSVRVLVVVAEAGLKVAVTPLDRPDADKLTLPVKPFSGATLMVLEPLDP